MFRALSLGQKVLLPSVLSPIKANSGLVKTLSTTVKITIPPLANSRVAEGKGGYDCGSCSRCRIPPPSELKAMSYREVQACCKKLGLTANSTHEQMLDSLLEKQRQQRRPICAGAAVPIPRPPAARHKLG